MSTAAGTTSRAAALAALGETDLLALRLIAAGHTTGEMAELMHLSHSGVKSVQKRLYRKLDARERANAVHLAWQHGLLRGPS